MGGKTPKVPYETGFNSRKFLLLDGRSRSPTLPHRRPQTLLILTEGHFRRTWFPSSHRWRSHTGRKFVTVSNLKVRTTLVSTPGYILWNPTATVPVIPGVLQEKGVREPKTRSTDTLGLIQWGKPESKELTVFYRSGGHFRTRGVPTGSIGIHFSV